MSITVAQLEREVAARAAPFEDHVVASGTTTTAVVAALQSTADDGGTYPGQWLLRRSAAAAADRQRRITSATAATGTLTLERAYAVAPAAGEAIEITPLDPTRHLRRGVLAGLARCYFVDRATVPVTAGRVEEDLSAALFWITDVGQIRGVQSLVGTLGVNRPSRLPWSEPIADDGGVLLGVRGATGGSYLVEALRPHATYVNGADAPNGPSLDADVLACPLDYAAAAGHVEVWRYARAVLAPVAEGPQRLAAPLKEATAEFNRLVRSQSWYWSRPDRVIVADPGPRGQDEFVTTGLTWSAVAATYSWRGLSSRSWREVLGGV